VDAESESSHDSARSSSANRAAKPVPGDVTIRGNTYPLTQNSKTPSRFVDSYNASDPFFDETHGDTAWRDATSVSAYDAPSPVENDVRDQFDAGATAVTPAGISTCT
jgi:hypothetical protein